MKIRSRKMMIITVIGMIIMIANGQEDRRAGEEGKIYNDVRGIEHEKMMQKEIKALESSGEKQEACVNEIKNDRKTEGETNRNKEGKQKDHSQNGIWYQHAYYHEDLPQKDDQKGKPNGSPRRDTEGGKRSQGPIWPPTGYGTVQRPSNIERYKHFPEIKRLRRKRTNQKSNKKRTSKCERNDKKRTSKCAAKLWDCTRKCRRNTKKNSFDL